MIGFAATRAGQMDPHSIVLRVAARVCYASTESKARPMGPSFRESLLLAGKHATGTETVNMCQLELQRTYVPYKGPLGDRAEFVPHHIFFLFQQHSWISPCLQSAIHPPCLLRLKQ